MDSVTDLTERLQAWGDTDAEYGFHGRAEELRLAAATLEALTQENARLRELCDAACSNAEMALNFLAEAGRPELAKTQAIYVANIRKALGGGE